MHLAIAAFWLGVGLVAGGVAFFVVYLRSGRNWCWSVSVIALVLGVFILQLFWL